VQYLRCASRVVPPLPRPSASPDISHVLTLAPTLTHSIDYYPKTPNDRFLSQVQEMYDKWCADGSIKFAIGETGNGWKATMEERLAWLEELTSEDTAKAMPHHVGISWFNVRRLLASVCFLSISSLFFYLALPPSSDNFQRQRVA